LIAEGTSASTDGTAATENVDDAAEDVADAEADELADVELELDDELLPHPTSTVTQITESGAASQLLLVRISLSLLEITQKFGPGYANRCGRARSFNRVKTLG
jgi:hypothetical protein